MPHQLKEQLIQAIMIRIESPELADRLTRVSDTQLSETIVHLTNSDDILFLVQTLVQSNHKHIYRFVEECYAQYTYATSDLNLFKYITHDTHLFSPALYTTIIENTPDTTIVDLIETYPWETESDEHGITLLNIINDKFTEIDWIEWFGDSIKERVSSKRYKDLCSRTTHTPRHDREFL